jgi:crotonobetainyl-CoA:carnitine CoA-transferase CaiB-like acyl-CoA transferase
MSAVMSILAALFRREATGEGSFCDVSMMDGAASWLSIHAAEFVATGTEPGRERMHLSGAYPCYRIYPAADGWLSVGALEPQFWAALCEAIERPDLAGDGFAMGERRDEVIASLEEQFSTKTRAEWMEQLGGLDVCVAPVKSFGEAFEDPQMRARGMIFEADVAGVGPWKHVGNPLKMSDLPRSEMRLSPPELGEHTDEVLGTNGFSAAEIDELREQGAIA